MSSTGTRPPLFDPDPEGFDGDHTGTPQFPLRRGAGSGGRPTSRGRDGSGSSSPRWVRPFIFGGLVLIAVVSLVSILGGGGDSSSTTVSDAAPTSAEPGATAEVPVGSPVGVDDLVVADEDGPTADPADAEAEGPDAADVTDATPVGIDVVAPVPVDDDARALSPELRAATAFAVQFTHDYLNYDQRQPEIRERELRAYLAPDLDPQLGWDGRGNQVAVLTVPLETVVDGDAVIVTVAAQVTGVDAPRWVHLAVPLAQDGRSRWAVTAQPAYVPRPSPGNPADPGAEEVDQALSTELTEPMETLFRAYGSDGDVAVAGVTGPDAGIRGLQGQVSFVRVDSVRIAAGDDDHRTGRIGVTWADPVTDGSISQTYRVELTPADDGTWLVDSVRAG